MENWLNQDVSFNRGAALAVSGALVLLALYSIGEQRRAVATAFSFGRVAGFDEGTQAAQAGALQSSNAPAQLTQGQGPSAYSYYRQPAQYYPPARYGYGGFSQS